jgi:amino acid adenylation domain-containing protein
MSVSLQGMTREEKLALLRRLREEEPGRGAGVAGRAAAAGPVPAPGPAEPVRYPVSFAQRRLWFLDQLDPESSHNTIFRAVRLSGPLDEEALARAVDALVERHGALRTRFEPTEGDPVQVVETPEVIGRVTRRVDLSRVPADEREEALRRLAHGEAVLPFDLARAPLLRVVLVDLDPAAAERALLVGVHHIVADGWSLAVFFRELSELYATEVERREPALPALEVTYGEIARAQRARLDGAGLERQMAFWRGELDGAPDVLDLPTDRPRPALGTFRGSTVPVELSIEGTAAVERLAREERATPFMLLLAAFAAVLGRWSRQRDVLVGVPIAGRDAAEAERVIGLFANTLVVRAELDGDGAPTFRDLVRRVRRRTLSALGHQETPFENLVEELVPTRDLSRNPLFQAMFALQNMPPAALSLGAARVAPIAVQRGLAKVDLTLDVRKTDGADGAFRGYLEYNTDLFDRATAERLARHFRTLTEAFTGTPDRPLAAHEMAEAAERETLLAEGGGAILPAPAGATVDSLFRAAAAERPGHPAVETADGSWSFRELRAGARRVAEALAGRGLSPGDRVGVLASRSPEALAAFLGVLEAGGAYVPLDPEYPADRLAYMLEDSGARLLLAGSRAIDVDLPGVERVSLDRDALFAGVEAGAEGAPPVRAPEPERPAYVIYTSGTTGKPKGVVIPHRALVSHATGILDEYRLTGDDRVYQFAATSFDIAGEEIYPSLAAGATLHLRPEGVTPSPEELVRTVAERGLSVVNVPTPLWHEWVGELAAGNAVPPPCLRLVVVGTEGALPERLAAWREALSGLGLSAEGEDRPRWVNAYGPTEGTITATTFSPGPDTPRRLHRVPIGRPIANVRAEVLAPAGRLAGLGVPGELCLGGANLALGYLGKPAATAAVFVPDPYGGGAGARLYRTGDLVRQRPGGTIEFLGRTDDQVKVRGFRIEPAEVEAALDAHPVLREVAVVPVEAGPGDTRLVAYVVPEVPPGPADDDVRSFLGRRLPSYMIPAAFVTLDALPMTPAGKIDRKALPRPDWSGAAEGSVAPRGPLEELIAAVWSEVLEVGMERVGVRDDFFRLGGHSLLATRVVSRLRDRLGVEVPLRRLFEAPTVEGLARVVAELRRGESAALPPIVPRDPAAEVPASFAQQRLWFLDRLEPGSVLYNMAFRVDLALDPAPTGAETIDEAALARAIGEIVRRHQSLRTTFERRGDSPLQVIRPAPDPEAFELPVADLSDRDAESAETEARHLALDEARTPFDLAAGPLVRFRLLRLPEARRHLLFTAHHTVSDGWSTDLFLGELAALYGAFARGAEPSLAEPPVQYGDFALWQRGWLDGDALAAMTEHWRRALDGAPRLLELPTDRPRPPVPSGEGARVPIALGEAATAGVRDLARKLGATPFMVLLTAYAAVLARWSGQPDVPVGTPIAGRGRSELEGLIGFFANTLAVRADLRPGESGRSPSFADAVARVREAALGAYAHQDLPFEKLVEELQPERSLSHHPIFQVFFAFQTRTTPALAAGSPAPSGDGPRLRPRLVPNDNRTARFDLALDLWEQGSGLGGFLEHATDLFDAATIVRMAEHLRVFLEAAAAAPETAIDDLPLMPAAERELVVEQWNATAAPFPEGATLPELVAERAAAEPDRTAVVFRGEHLSGAELLRRARAVATRLRALGVGRDDVVGVAMERSTEMVVALVGIQSAGAAYLPLDPSLPAGRLAFMAADAGARAVLTQDALLGAEVGETLRATGLPVLALDAPDWSWSGDPAAGAGSGPLPESGAYVIFTSGSTGKPKGVLVPHRGIVNRLVWMQRAYGLDGSDRVLQKTPCGFDVSVWELFWPLLSGSCLVVAEPGRHGDAAWLADAVARYRITTLHFVPSMLQVFLEHPNAGAPPGPRRVIASGEALPPSLARRFAERLPAAALHNLYGPTEASVDVTFHECRDETASTVPIGRPIENLRVYVLDPRGRPAPVGVPGELHLGGVGLARGYVARPALTAERFVPDPFARSDREAGGRLYRTGDLCRTLAGGEIEFLGRIDFQVKLRGLRIELGEIEAVLAGHPCVRETVVTAPADATGDVRLVAYWVPAGEAPDEDELRRHVARTLPEHMVPSAFVVLDALPLSPNGKVDRRALPAPETGAAPSREFVAPRDATETALAEIWREVLGVERVGVHDNFFELGGHSLKATQTMTRVEERFGFEVPLRAIFELPTVGRLAERIAELELEFLDPSALTEALDEIDNLSEDELAALLGDGVSELSE